MMWSVWMCVLLLLMMAMVNGEDALASPLRVAQCRAQCLQRFWRGSTACLQGPDCFMCWQNCELLQSNFAVWGAICNERNICFPGCQQACHFHRETAKQKTVIRTRGEEVITLSGSMASWPQPAKTFSPLVYVLMRRQQGSSWRQIFQTVELSGRLPAATLTDTIRVLVVSPEGLVTIYSPTGSSGTQQRRRKINTEILPSITPGMWKLHEVSLIHQKVLVTAEVTWEPRLPRAVYLVTWEVDGGGLKGNLFTDSTCVTLSLWPDTVYHIQVELVSRTASSQAEHSEVLVLDTRKSLTAVSSPLLSVLVSHPGDERREFLTGSIAALLLFLLVVAALGWRCRTRSQPPCHEKLCVPLEVEPAVMRPGVEETTLFLKESEQV